jgi:hypothetical protein
MMKDNQQDQFAQDFLIMIYWVEHRFHDYKVGPIDSQVGEHN